MGDQHLPPPFTYGYPSQPANVEEMKALVDQNSGRDALDNIGPVSLQKTRKPLGHPRTQLGQVKSQPRSRTDPVAPP
ncbi:hypothetical protein FOCG_12181 [Fusarium oxysporum f. sp. radicis-lycopersici 26381]|uniref:Uncharacterized protein n=2 Tax=Fusarium oxysporum TaxID=5507 RepID=A0A4Q2W9M1_FUSOX|nr:hypothetical protein FOCG_12181 [Fusarium oxysporum f. sp. radicis-lycopersici 26381]KAJ0138007.1 Uncharacterized protein HZ326_19043 [Fusarium oxysporum f. sp. albedinis]RKK28254.1 hypothetical protein BFJ65_g201 [Fusarium oxysporum f. sp. cepae]RKL24414.1 hypothetical protein BFJ70_g12577 [Fusarium oxysporum]RYC96716.1 hypothetical protein BFJ63_vAg574 [Fusarium oxysporum f. sp. narcissi]